MKNGYLDNLYKELSAFYDERDVYLKEEKRRADAYGYNSKEYMEWAESHHMPKNPFTKGVSYCIQAYVYSINHNSEYIIFGDYLWHKKDDYIDFVLTLRKANIKSFILTYDGSGLMDELNDFYNTGCRLGDIVNVSDKTGIMLHII